MMSLGTHASSGSNGMTTPRAPRASGDDGAEQAVTHAPHRWHASGTATCLHQSLVSSAVVERLCVGGAVRALIGGVRGARERPSRIPSSAPDEQAVLGDALREQVHWCAEVSRRGQCVLPWPVLVEQLVGGKPVPLSFSPRPSCTVSSIVDCVPRWSRSPAHHTSSGEGLVPQIGPACHCRPFHPRPCEPLVPPRPGVGGAISGGGARARASVRGRGARR